MRLVLLALVISTVAHWGYSQQDERARHLAFVPPALAVDHVLYSDEETGGFGPGGNETGIIVYAMSKAARERIEADGIP